MSLKEVQEISLNILKDVHRFCEKNEIAYTLYGGTMIGAIRHKGFIPWDDDIDIAMPRRDYERFCNTYRSKSGYRVFHAGNSDCILTFARVCEVKETIAFYPQSPWIKEKVGVWIDVFPLDDAPDDVAIVEAHINTLIKQMRRLYLHRQANASFCSEGSVVWNVKLLVKKLLKRFWWEKPSRIVEKYINNCRSFENASCCHFCNFSYTGFGIKEYQLKEDFKSTLSVPFEDSYFCCANGYDRIMRTKYGDYMTIPPKEQQRVHPMNCYWR